MSNNIIAEGNYKAVAVPRAVDGGPSQYVHIDQLGDNDIPVCIAYFKILNAEDAPRYPIRWQGWLTTKDKDGNRKVDKNGKTSAKRTVESLKAMGHKGTDLSSAVTDELNQIVEVMVVHREYDDPKTGEEKKIAEVLFVNAAGGKAIKLSNPMSGNALKTFSNRMKAGLMDVADIDGERSDAGNDDDPGDNGEPRVDSSGGMDQSIPPIDDEDIPF